MITEKQAIKLYCYACHPRSNLCWEKNSCNGLKAYLKFGKEQGLIELSHLEKAKKIKETIIKLLGG